MIKHAVTPGLLRRGVGIYLDSVTVRMTVRLFDWAAGVFEHSLTRILFLSASMETRRLLRCQALPGTAVLGRWYGESRLLRVLRSLESVTVTVMRHNCLFRFFLEDEASHES